MMFVRQLPFRIVYQLVHFIFTCDTCETVQNWLWTYVAPRFRGWYFLSLDTFIDRYDHSYWIPGGYREIFGICKTREQVVVYHLWLRATKYPPPYCFSVTDYRGRVVPVFTLEDLEKDLPY